MSYRLAPAAGLWCVAMDHDAAHKYLYTLAPVVADLLRLVVPDWAEQLDLAAPEDVSTEFLDEAHRKRVGDMAWKVRFRNGELADGSRPYILLLVEFQSTADRHMARRIREYTDMLLDRLIRNDVMAREGGLPWTLAVVVYNGGERWTAIGEESHLARVPALAARDLALLQPQLYRRIDANAGSEQDWPEHNLVAATVRLQRSATPDEIWLRLSAEARRFSGPTRGAFREALHAWAKAMWANETGAEAAFPSFEDLEQEKQEMATILQARWADLRAEERELGVAQGRELGVAQGRELGVAQGRELGVAQGRELGVAQGRELGRADERIRREAALKFGTSTADRLVDHLASLTTREDLDRVGDWIIECESGDELLLRLQSIAST